MMDDYSPSCAVLLRIKYVRAFLRASWRIKLITSSTVRGRGFAWGAGWATCCSELTGVPAVAIMNNSQRDEIQKMNGGLVGIKP